MGGIIGGLRLPQPKTRTGLARHNPPMGNAYMDIAAVAAALVVDEGLDYRSAKRRAQQRLGLPARAPMPDNLALDQAVRAYLDLFRADTQPAELTALRRLARRWMARLSDWQPALCGPVWHGLATRRSDVILDLYGDDAKSLEIDLINRGVRFQSSGGEGRDGPLVLSLDERCEELDQWVTVHLRVHDLQAQRGAFLPDALGRKPRGDAAALDQRMREDEDLSVTVNGTVTVTATAATGGQP